MNIKTIFNSAIFYLVALALYLLALFFYVCVNSDSNILNFVSVSLIVAFLVLFLRSRVAYALTAFIFSVVISLEVAFVFVYGSRVGRGVVSSIMDTNKNEFFSEGHTVIYPFLFVLCLTACVFSLFYFRTKPRIKNNIMLFVFCFLVGVSNVGAFLWGQIYNHDLLKDLQDTENLRQLTAQVMFDKYPLVFGDIFALYSDFIETREISRHASHNKLPAGIVFDASAKTQNTIVIIIGESSLRTHYSSYGYDVDTTPGMKRIFSTPNSCAIQKVHSSASVTKDAIRMSLTFSTPHDNSPYFDNENIIEMARNAGYKAYWVSSTNERGFYSSYVGMISSYSNFFSDQTARNGLNTSDDDVSLIDGFKSVFNKNERQIIFIHLNGSHMPYKRRYDSIDAAAIKGSSGVILDYDRSLHHTDRAVSSMYDFLSSHSNDYVFFYAPDHGEIVNEGPLSGWHGLTFGAAATGIGHGLTFGGPDQYKIPMMIKYSSGNFCQDIEKYRNKDGYINSFAEHDLFSEFMGYTVTPEALDIYMKESPFVYHADGNMYRYPFLPHK